MFRPLFYSFHMLSFSKPCIGEVVSNSLFICLADYRSCHYRNFIWCQSIWYTNAEAVFWSSLVFTSWYNGLQVQCHKFQGTELCSCCVIYEGSTSSFLLQFQHISMLSGDENNKSISIKEYCLDVPQNSHNKHKKKWVIITKENSYFFMCESYVMNLIAVLPCGWSTCNHLHRWVQ